MFTAFSTQPAHLVRRFAEQARLNPDKPLFFEKTGGEWRGLSYAQTADQVSRLARYLKALGLQAGDHVVLCGENRVSWAVSDLAIMTMGAVVVPAYTTNTADDHAYLVSHSEAKLVICSGGKVADTLFSVLAEQDRITDIICMDPLTEAQEPPEGLDVHLFDEITAVSGEVVLLEEMIYPADEEDPACLIYTSGTGGRPKGVLLTHKSIQANIDAAFDLLAEGRAEQGAVFLSLLPLSHAYEHTAGLHLPVQMAAEVWYCEGRDKISANLAEVKPTLMTAVPRLYELLHDRITKGVAAKGGLSAKLFAAAVRLGRKKLAGKRLGVAELVLDKLLEGLVRKKVRQRFGGRLAYFVSGGAALNPDIGTFFLALGVNILQGYGQTEASPLISANRPGRIRIETVGPAVDGVEVKLGEDGELLARGDCLMKGYWRNQAATEETLVKGWLHTGDIAEIDDDGYITITGRKKDMIVNSGGDNIAPTKVEAEYGIEPEIAQIMVWGDKRPHLVAVIVPSDELATLDKAEQTAKIGAAIRRAGARLSGYERVRHFLIADEAFSVENSQMTPTLKVRRHVVSQVYEDRLAGLYRTP